MEKYIYFINEEHSAGTDCCQYGTWTNVNDAKRKLEELVKDNKLGHFGEDSEIDIEEGTAYSNNDEDDYTMLTIEKLPLQNFNPLFEFIMNEVRYRYTDDKISCIEKDKRDNISEEFLAYACSELFENTDILFDYDKLDNKLEEIYIEYMKE